MTSSSIAYHSARRLPAVSRNRDSIARSGVDPGAPCFLTAQVAEHNDDGRAGANWVAACKKHCFGPETMRQIICLAIAIRTDGRVRHAP